MNIIIESSCLILSAIFISLFLAPNNNNSHLTLLYIVRYRLYNKKEKTPTNRQVPKSQHLATVGSKISLLTGRNFQQTRLEEGQPSSRGSLFFPPPPPSSTPHPFSPHFKPYLMNWSQGFKTWETCRNYLTNCYQIRHHWTADNKPVKQQ